MNVSPDGQAVILTDQLGGVLLLKGNDGSFKYGYSMPGIVF